MGKFKDFPGDFITIRVLEKEIELYKTRLREHDTGHINTTISYLKHRIDELKGVKEWKFD
tara:strand:- start:187 stop:366 length:180 start_codon:yes stop_codon:yes gene_type:complete